MTMHPMIAERWRGAHVPRLRELARVRGECPVGLLLGCGLEWRAIAELRGELPLRVGTAEAVALVIGSLGAQATA